MVKEARSFTKRGTVVERASVRAIVVVKQEGLCTGKWDRGVQGSEIALQKFKIVIQEARSWSRK